MILELSKMAVCMIIAVLLLRAAGFSYLPKKIYPLLWICVLARLLLPFHIPSRFSVFNLISALLGNAGEKELYLSLSLKHAAPPAAPAYPFAVSPLLLIYFLGVIGVLLYFTVAYCHCVKIFRESVPAGENPFITQWQDKMGFILPVQIRTLDKITAPLTYGVFRPTILLPKQPVWENTQQLEYILAHEAVHIHRLDNLWKILMVLALAIHWFNPFVWIMFIYLNRDLELSCDERILHIYGPECRAGYAGSLIAGEEVKTRLNLLFCGYSGKATGKRILAVMKFRRCSACAMICAYGVIGITLLLFGTSPGPSPISGQNAVFVTHNAMFTQGDLVAPLPDSPEPVKGTEDSFYVENQPVADINQADPPDGEVTLPEAYVPAVLENIPPPTDNFQEYISISPYEGTASVTDIFSDNFFEADISLFTSGAASWEAGEFTPSGYNLYYSEDTGDMAHYLFVSPGSSAEIWHTENTLTEDFTAAQYDVAVQTRIQIKEDTAVLP